MRKPKSPRNPFEMGVAKLLKVKKIAFEYEPHGIPYTIESSYIPDFLVKVQDFYIETKGFLRPEDRQKLVAVKKQHPHLDIRIWFQADNYLTKAKKRRYSDWAKQHKFPCHVGTDLPTHWFKK